MVSSLSLPAEDLRALLHRLWGSFLGRCVQRFLGMSGLDRCIVLSSQAFTALIPLLILVSTLAPAGQEDLIARSITSRFALTGDSAAGVEELFATSESSTSSLSIFSALLLLVSGVSFARRLQAMYHAAWHLEKVRMRSDLFAALGLLTLLVEVVAAYAVRAWFERLPLDWLWTLPLTAAIGIVLWTSIPYLLLDRQVHWRRLLVSGAVAGIATALYGVATAIYMPALVTRYTNEFGLFGITIALIGWLLAVSGVVIASTAIGAEFDASQELWAFRLKRRFKLMTPGDEPPVPDPQLQSAGLNTGDLLMLVRVLVNWSVMAAAVWVATAVVPGITVVGGFWSYVVVSLLLGLVNAILGPLLHLVALPLTVLTLGCFALAVNGVLLAVTAGLSTVLDIGGLGSAVLGALVISLVTAVLELVVRPIAREPAAHQAADLLP